MPPLRVTGLTSLLRQPSIFVFRSPILRYAPHNNIHARPLRTRAGARRGRGAGTIDVQGRSRPQEVEEEEDLEDDLEDQLDDVDGDGGGSEEAEFQRFLEEQQEIQPKPKKRKLKASRPSATDHDEDISFYDQEEGDLDSRRQTSRNPDEAIKPFEEDEDEIDEDIEEAEDELDELEEDEPYIPPDPDLEADRKRLFGDVDLEKLQESFAQSLKDFAPEAAQLDGHMPHMIQPQGTLSSSGRLFLTKLNDALDDASLNAQKKDAQQNLWRYYERSKIYIPDIVKVIPDEAWKLLWVSQSEESPTNPFRASHLKTLSEDMVKAGKALTQEQRYARLEGLFWDGKQDEALAQWELGLKSGDAGNAEYLELGIRMYAYDRNLIRAEDLVDVLFKLHTNYDPRILLQVISASIGLNTSEGYERGFRLYQRLRTVLTDDIKMEDFDTISLDYLRFGQKDYALAIFRDMMLLGEKRKSQSGFRNAVSRLGQFMSSSSNAAEVNILGLEGLKSIPPQFQNKWFYASWMRKLLAMGENGPAAEVMDLMYERGVKPDARHVNGLINGWLRTSHRPSHKHAEKMAWAMIQARLNFVSERWRHKHNDLYKPPASIHDISPNLPTSSSPSDKPIIPTIDPTRRIPPATIETFSLMAQWYLRRSQFATVSHLRNLLLAAELPMNSFFMNHLLYAELRHRSYRAVWERFEAMTPTVRPDIETFTCLWECMKQHVDPAVNRDPRGFPRPRELLHRMRVWFAALKGQEKRDALTDLDIDGYNDIIRCFCLSRDPAGSFVALLALKEMFNIAPEESTMRMLVLQISRLGVYKPRDHKEARRITASERNRENVEQTTQVLQMILEYRRMGYAEEGFDVEGLGDEETREERVRVALQLLYTVVKQVQVGRDEVGNLAGREDEVGIEGEGGKVDVTPAITKAAREIGYEIGDVEECMSLVG